MVIGAAPAYAARFIQEDALEAAIDAQFDGVTESDETLDSIFNAKGEANDLIRASLATLINPNSNDIDAMRAAARVRFYAGKLVNEFAQGKF
jgi:hypothetical protein